MTINTSREAVTEPLVEYKPSAPARVLVAVWHSDALWALWLAVRVAVCVASIWYGAVFAQSMARGDGDAAAMALVVGAVIAVSLGRWKAGDNRE